MHLQQRIHLLVELGRYMLSDNADWQAAKERAFLENKWFIPEFIDLAVENIATEFLQEKKLRAWAERYDLPAENRDPKNIGLVMAGNIPLVGFHDFLAIFISGHRQTIKPSSRDQVLIKQLTGHLNTLDAGSVPYISFAEMLKGCDAYIATGSNNSARYFDYYFGKYPNIIRHNRTSVAILNGKETSADLEKLADDVNLFFGLGCRNVTKIYVPQNYDFIPLLEALKKFNYLSELNKYKNNYDYQLTMLIMNKKYYMANESVLLTEDPSPFSPIACLHFEYYSNLSGILASLEGNEAIQCVVGKDYIPFGQAQKPCLTDYADGMDTLQFLREL
jgi:hypothetical protein